MRAALAAALAALATFGGATARADTTPADSPLRAVVAIVRHGVRSPTDPAELVPYAARAWPAWEVAPGELTPHGAAAIRLLGAAYRRAFAQAGFVPSAGCLDPGLLTVRPDVDERTVASARAFVDGFAPGCGAVPLDPMRPVDPLFHPVPTIRAVDAAASRAALERRVGPDPQSIVASQSAGFATLDRILGCDAPAATCRRLGAVPASFATGAKSGLSSIEGAPALASTAVEDFTLAYEDGKPPADVGWGAVDAATLAALAPLHALKYELAARTAPSARALGSNLVMHALGELEDAAAAGRHPRFVAYVGHDTNLAAVGALLDAHWRLGGAVRDDTPPGGALVFEERGSGDAATIRLFYAAQTSDEVRNLDASAPLHRVAVTIPGCGPGACPLGRFADIVRAAADPAFVSP